MPRQPVTAQPPAARPINLRTSARLVDDGFRWENGISLLPEECLPGFSMDPCEGPETTKPVTEPATVVEWDPYIIGSSAACDYTLNDDAFAELAGRARRSLEAQTSYLVEQILWTNTVDGVDFGATHPNVGLIETVTVGTPAPPRNRFGTVGDFAGSGDWWTAGIHPRPGTAHAPFGVLRAD